MSNQEFYQAYEYSDYLLWLSRITNLFHIIWRDTLTHDVQSNINGWCEVTN